MSILPTWPIAAGALVLGIAGGAYVDHKVMQGRIDKIQIAHTEQLRVREVQRAKDEVAAREAERLLAVRAGQIEQRKIDEIATINARHAAAIAGLQQRPDRKPTSSGGVPAPSTTCQGATGAELSRPDAELALRIARDADEQREALRACYAAYDSFNAGG